MVLTVASIPVALPAILTVTMAVGAVNLTKKGAIVSKLASIEELAGVDVLCSDKTGTLTKNKLTPSNPISAGNFSENDVLIYACLASQRDVNDAIDDAIFKAVENKREISDSLASYKTVNFVPFDPVIKRSEAEVSLSDSQPFKVTKGAPQIIFNLIDDKDFNRKDWEEKVNELAGKGYRVLGVAAQLENKGWKFIGLTPLFDPPRDDSAETIKQANEMGIDVKMVTGDNRAIAKEIAKKLGMKSNILEADKLNSIATHDLEDMVEKADGFAEVFPEHKYSIIKLLQKLKHFVGMTGDGVNDAPALRMLLNPPRRLFLHSRAFR
jgi:H+-transporting ATPase